MRIAIILTVLVLTAATVHAFQPLQPLGTPQPAPAPMWQPPVWQPPQWQPPMWQPPQNTSDNYLENMWRGYDRKRESYIQQELQAEQQRQLERATRCARFGSREVWGDCNDW